MPRFNDDEHISRRSLNDERDRSVPDEENYYRSYENIESSDATIRDNQDGYVDINSFIDSFDNGAQSVRQAPQRQQIQQNQTPNRPKKPKRKKSGKGALLGIIAVILIIAILPVGIAFSALGKITYDDKKPNEYVDQSELVSDTDIKNVLFLGVDARAGENGDESRSDSMMVISIDTKHECIKAVSFLRDTWIYIPCNDGKQRLNAACSYGGYSGVVDTIEYNFGIDIDGYVVADFTMFQSLVDGIGGVKVDVTEEEANEVTSHPKRYGDVVLESGEQKLTGAQALAYCRIRKIDTDFVRTKRQRTVINSIINGVKKKPYKIFKMANNCAKYIETDLTKSEIIKLGTMMTKCLGDDMVQDKVPFENTWEYATRQGASVIAINVEKNKDKLIDYIYNKSADEIKAEQSE